MVRTRQDLRRFQKRAIPFMAKRKCAALLADMGLGKTATALYVIRRLLKKQRAIRALIVAPVQVLATVWETEAQKWKETRYLRFMPIIGNEDQRIMALNTKADVYLISPDNYVWLLKVLSQNDARGHFDILIIDESSKFKAHDTVRFKTAKKYVSDFRYRYILTGTPSPNSLLELWPQYYLLDEGERLGTSFTRFRNTFFHKPHPKSFKYVLNGDWAEEKISELISDITLRLEDNDWLDIPELVYAPIHIELPSEARKVYRQLEKEMVVRLKELLKKRRSISAVNIATLIGKCHQLANGACYLTDDEDNPTKEWREFHREKLEALDETLEQIGRPTIVAYQYRHDLERLQHRYPKIPNIGRGTKDIKTILKNWNNNKYPFLFMHRSSSFGLNMHEGGARHVIFFSLTYSRENFDQLIARVGPARRTGQKKPTMVYPIIAKNTVDEQLIWPSLIEKHAQQKSLLDGLRELAINKHGIKI